jgi:hypothetical protein
MSFVAMSFVSELAFELLTMEARTTSSDYRQLERSRQVHIQQRTKQGQAIVVVQVGGQVPAQLVPSALDSPLTVETQHHKRKRFVAYPEV